MSIVAPAAARGRSLRIADPFVIIACAAMALGIVLRLVARPNLPLWLDETWTGVRLVIRRELR